MRSCNGLDNSVVAATFRNITTPTLPDLAPGDDCLWGPPSGRASIVKADRFEPRVHPHKRLLHVLRMGCCELYEFLLAQIGTPRTNLQAKSESCHAIAHKNAIVAAPSIADICHPVRHKCLCNAHSQRSA